RVIKKGDFANFFMNLRPKNLFAKNDPYMNNFMQVIDCGGSRNLMKNLQKSHFLNRSVHILDLIPCPENIPVDILCDVLLNVSRNIVDTCQMVSKDWHNKISLSSN